jgi:hypothetical protein
MTRENSLILSKGSSRNEANVIDVHYMQKNKQMSLINIYKEIRQINQAIPP